MESETIRRLISDIKKSKELFMVSSRLVAPPDIPNDFAEEYCEEFYPFFLFQEGEAQLKYYRDFKQVLRMEAMVKPVIYNKELLQLKQFTFKYKSDTKDLDKLIAVLEKIGELYKFNEKSLSMKEVQVMHPLHTDFESYETEIKKSITRFLKEVTSKEDLAADFDDYESNAEMTYISLFRMVVYGMYTLPIDESVRTKLTKVINKHEKVENK